MPEASLHSTSPLNGYTQTFDDTRLWETSALAIVTVALPNGGRGALDEQIRNLWQLSFPETGKCIRNGDASVNGIGTSLALLGMQIDQCLLVLEPVQQSTEETVISVCASLDTTAYLTDQSDSLAVLDLQGPLAVPALERICMLDLSTFDSTQVARTSMEHSPVIIEMPVEEHFRLYAPRSSAKSFLHAITTSLSSVSHG